MKKVFSIILVVLLVVLIGSVMSGCHAEINASTADKQKSEFYEMAYGNSYKNKWLADIDGSYGENDTGIFFFTSDGKYIEWNGSYLYSDIPFTVDSPVLSIEGGK